MALNLVMSLFLFASLKTVWRLITLIQVLVYLRLFTSWPVLCNVFFETVNDAITLKSVTDALADLGKDTFADVSAGVIATMAEHE